MRLSHLGQHGSPRGLYISPTNNEREERSKTVGTVCVEGFYNAVPVVAAELPGEVVPPRCLFFFSRTYACVHIPVRQRFTCLLYMPLRVSMQMYHVTQTWIMGVRSYAGSL